MKRAALSLAALALAALLMASAAEVVNPGGGPKREDGVPTSSNLVESAIPQLAPNTNTGPEVRMARETYAPATPVPEPAPAPPRSRNALWMIVAVLVLLVGRPLLKRLRSGPDSS
jgi:hypothetical protein